jgi:hypothetical protein
MADENMVERVRKSRRTTLSVFQPDNEPGSYYVVDAGQAIAGPFQSFDRAHDEYERIHAKAAIAAMREPTEVITDAIRDNVIGYDAAYDGSGREVAEQTWRDAIDAALKD